MLQGPSRMRRAHVQRLIPYVLPLFVLGIYRVVANLFFSSWKRVNGERFLFCGEIVYNLVENCKLLM